MADPAAHPYRIGNQVLPRTYRLLLEPDLDQATFSGEVEIDVDVIEAVSSVALNALDLEISSVSISSHTGDIECAVELDEATERAILRPSAELQQGPATLRLTFTGILNDQLVGFYRSTFIDPDGQTRTIATTQMEATDARRAFPCFDEPAKKASFEISLVVPDGLAAYSNSPIVSEEDTGRGSRLVRFAPTMVMSTYLVAFIVGPFDATDAIDVDGVPVRVVYPPGKGHLAPFALEVAAHSLRYFTDYFGIAYPGDKLDLVAIPDFAFGAMENLGCVTFRETALLVDPEAASRVEVERVVDVIAHEIAHMWFGDLVTMGWWEGIWLNEAFATFMEIKCTDSFRPGWHRWVSFGTSRQAAMSIDGLHTTRPIEFVVESPADARGMFDLLTYEKGGSVLRMLEQHLGEDVFRDGIRHYLETHAYANTVTQDLWDSLSAVSGQPVGEIMDTWILQGGHPIISVEDGIVRQTPFSYGPSDGESAIGTMWQVPLSTRSLDGGQLERRILDDQPIAVAPGTLINAGGWGVYRTHYGAAELEVITAGLSALDPLERATLVADTWAATLAGNQEVSAFLSLASGLGTQVEPATWAVVTSALNTIDAVIDDADRPALAAAVRSLLGQLHDDLGWDGSGDTDEQAPTLRSMVLATLGTIGEDEAVRSEALRRFESGDPEGDLASAILSVVGSVGRAQDFEIARSRYGNASSPQSESRNLYAMAGFASTELSLTAFSMALTDEVRSQDAPYFVSRLLANHAAGSDVFRSLEERWNDAMARFPKDAHSRMLTGISQQIGDRSHARRVAGFVASHPVHSGQRTVLQDVERMMVGVAFGERERERLADRLRRITS
jgi:puromycin-sensitive aminopeptidase